MKIFVMTHKDVDLELLEGYDFLRIGANKQYSGDMQSDDTGVNISNKNSNFCELTGLYWMNKNTDYDQLGLVHYRRFFYKNNIHAYLNRPLSEENAKKYLSNYDIIVPEKTWFNPSVKSDYDKFHHISDLLETKEIIHSLYGSDFDSAFDEVLNRQWLYCYNMLVTSKTIFDEYSNWLFPILFELEKRIDISSYDSYNQRVFGFISERLFNVWLEGTKYSVKELPVWMIQENYKFNGLKSRLARVKKRIEIAVHK